MYHRVHIWPAELPDASPTILKVASGNVSQEDTELSRSFDFTVPHSIKKVLEEYGDDMLVTGAWVEVLTSLTGRFSDSDKKCWFYGSIVETDIDRQQQSADDPQPVVGSYKALDPLQAALSVGVNISFATKMLVMENVFTAADFDASDPYFLVNLPDDPSFPTDWVEEGFISLSAYKVGGGPDEETGHIDYDKSEFVYSAAVKQLEFTRSQEEPNGPDDTTPQADFEWVFKLLYYDPDDDDHTVTKLILQVLTGDPNSDAGGCGFDPADVDLDEIYGFDGVTPKKVRSFIWEKINGPASAVFDKLRELGLIPVNYRIAYNPVTRMVEGRHDVQDNDAAITIGKVKHERMPYTIQDAAVRVECWSKAVTPENYALAGVVTLNAPAGYSTFPATDPEKKLIDGKPGTSLQFQKELTTLNYPPTSTPTNAVQLDLGALERIGEINFRGASPKEEDGSDIIEIPVYFESRLPKVSISVTDDPADLVGIPVSPEAIAFSFNPREPDVYADGRFEANLIHHGRYVLLRWEQDYFYRRDGNNIGSVARQSNFPVSELRVLGDGRYRYPIGHPEERQLPSAYLTNRGDDISAFDSGLQVITVSTAQAALFQVGEFVMLWDTSLGVPFDGYWTITLINTGTGQIRLMEALPGALAIGDQMGPFKRWMQALTNDWIDLKAPKLYRKLVNTTKRLEFITDLVPASLAEAEQLCVERLLELNTISRDFECEVPLRHDIDIGTTIRTYPGRPAWLVRRFTLNIPPSTGRVQPVTINFGGNDYEEPMQ